MSLFYNTFTKCVGVLNERVSERANEIESISLKTMDKYTIYA